MAIYRGVGGAGDISSGITLNEVTTLTLRAEDAAVESEASAVAAAAAEAGVAADAADASLSKTQAASSATDSAESATLAAASYDAFDDRYLGSKSSAPTLDNDGNALLTGALYWNSTSSNLWVYNGSAWEQATLTASDFLSSSDIGVSVQAYDATIVVDADIGVTVQGYDANNTTSSNTQTLTNKTISAADNTLVGVASTGKAIAMAIVFGG